MAAKVQALMEVEAISGKEKTVACRSDWAVSSENPDTHVAPRNFYRQVYLQKVKETGLDGVTWHTLRHTFASRLAMSGATERHDCRSVVAQFHGPGKGVPPFESIPFTRGR